jgi:hypothetical protein
VLGQQFCKESRRFYENISVTEGWALGLVLKELKGNRIIRKNKGEYYKK